VSTRAARAAVQGAAVRGGLMAGGLRSSTRITSPVSGDQAGGTDPVSCSRDRNTVSVCARLYPSLAVRRLHHRSKSPLIRPDQACMLWVRSAHKPLTMSPFAWLRMNVDQR
jgi:hypothetical protein